jgi:hypothetical protein
MPHFVHRSLGGRAWRNYGRVRLHVIAGVSKLLRRRRRRRMVSVFEFPLLGPFPDISLF